MRKMVSSFVAVLGLAIVAGTPAQSQTPTLTTLVSFNRANGSAPVAGLLADAKGNLFGTTLYGGISDRGTVFEIEKTASGYASAPTILYTFCDQRLQRDCADGANPTGNLIADANGNLFGTTESGGDTFEVGTPPIMVMGGTVFEIEKTDSGYASAPTVLVRFNRANGANPQAGLIADANGNLFGTTTDGGANDLGTVFEIAKTDSGYASTPTILVNFNGSDGGLASAGLLADANGNLFGTTDRGGANDLGTVFEIPKTDSGYASTLTVLVSFNGANGWAPRAGLVADANGNLFGTTGVGGANGLGTVFEIEKIASGYASTPTILYSFCTLTDCTDGWGPNGKLAVDANGNLFGTTSLGGTNDVGTVFEIEKTGSGYASTPTILVRFNRTNGSYPEGGLIADASGNLFGTTVWGGANGFGTVFELQNTGFVPFPIFAGKQETPNCAGVSVSALARQYGGIKNAAAALGYSSVSALQGAVRVYCRSSE